jgi:hypothetical protein
VDAQSNEYEYPLSFQDYHIKQEQIRQQIASSQEEMIQNFK